MKQGLQYFTDLVKWNAKLIQKIENDTFMLLHDARTSGKSSDILRVTEQLLAKDYISL